MSGATVVATMLGAAMADAEAAGRAGRRAWFHTATFAPSELLAPGWPSQAADLFAYAIEREGWPSGAWLAWDVSAAWRLHLHGVVVTTRDQVGVDRLWHQLGRHALIASTLTKRVQFVTGSLGDWRGPKVQRQVRQMVAYCDRAKAWPRAVPKPALQHRQVVSGIFAQYLDTALADDLVADAVAVLPAIATDTWQGRALARLHRQCAVCGADLTPGGRRDRATCSGRCRVAKHRADRAAGGAP